MPDLTLQIIDILMDDTASAQLIELAILKLSFVFPVFLLYKGTTVHICLYLSHKLDYHLKMLRLLKQKNQKQESL